MERLRLEDGSLWPNPTSDKYRELSYRLRHNMEYMTQADCHTAAEIMDAYYAFILHPAMTLRELSRKVSMIRKAIKNKSTQ